MPPATTANPEWPPRSPHEALLSTPSGRDRLRRLAERASPSPSPTKRPASSASFRNRALDLMKDDMEDEEEDDDEETLQLQLQEIQARLKLKKLQKKTKQSSESENDSNRASSSQPTRSLSVAASRAQSRIDGIREARLERSRSQAAIIDVPVSPIRRVRQPEPQRSPGRVLLGIDKGLRGSDISLKRAPSLRKREDAAFKDRLAGPFLQRPVSQMGSRISSSASSSQETERPKSFSERLAAMRTQDVERQEREVRVKKNRSSAFDIDHEQMENYKKTAVTLADAPRIAPSFSREDILTSYSNPGAGLIRKNTNPDLRSAMRNTSNTDSTASGSFERPVSRSAANAPRRRMPALSPTEEPDSDPSQFEPFSSVHLSKRIIPHHVLTRTLSGKKTFLIPDLLKTVKGPDFQGPDIEEDVVVFGIIAKKSEPRAHAPNSNLKNPKKGKYMILGLTDLKWELDLFLFDSAFDKFWKLAAGTIIAILNPMFMAPMKGRSDTGKWSLTLNSDCDTILEIGNARDLGFCKSVKKDGKTCDTWVDKRHTEYCDYHVNATLEKTKKGRMEVNTMTGGNGRFGKNSRVFDPTWAQKKKDIELEKKTRWDKDSGTQIFIGQAQRSTANLLDNVDFNPDAFHRGSSKEERMTRQILAQERERDLMKKLGQVGGGQGAEYMRKKDYTFSHPGNHSHSASSFDSAMPPPDASALGLKSTKASDVALSPIKRKRDRANTTSSSMSAAVGWGGNLTKELGRMKEGGNLLPVKKKTRFVTAKGIREAGRESLGGDVLAEVGKGKGKEVDLGSDDDDDLDIVR